ncbi:SMI1/KNR4 family protein [Cohnella sp.]|uniref:SMI1/KNR4 family protein n=1 Tax=Cohnella sp. TaxID=1883426 RepID=UPI003566A1B1
MEIREIIETVRSTPNCVVLPPKGIPQTEDNLKLSNDLREFYETCGGITLFQHADYQVNIVSPEDFVLANPVIVGERCDEDISSNWYIVASDGRGEYLTIDLDSSRLGKCYDSFFDRHGVVGESQVIALSFVELLKRLIQNKGQYWYWLKEDFVSLGDAYDI